MAIDYIEVRDINREIIGIIDDAKSIIWHDVFFGCGDFEIFIKATPENIQLLQENRYITKAYSDQIAIIEKVHIEENLQDGNMITATGRFAKSILDRRLIYNLSGSTNKPTILRGNVEQNIRKLVQDNAISCSFDSKRNIGILELGTLSNIPDIIVDENGNATQKQVSYENLLQYTDSVLEEYGLTSVVYVDLDNVSKKLKFRVEKGIDRSKDNQLGIEPIVFSQDFDNLLDSIYTIDTSTEKNVALIGGEGEGAERFYSVLAPDYTGLDRKELFVDASSKARVLSASTLQNTYPASGRFVGLDFLVNGVVYATLVTGDHLKEEISLTILQSKFPSGTVSGTKFIVGGVTYATQIYGETDKYNYTPLGYKANLDVEGMEGDYQLVDGIYKTMLDTTGKQNLASYIKHEGFEGTIDVTSGNYLLNRDFWLGDIVTVQDNNINKYMNVRIVETTEVQDENGYMIDVTYK